MSIAVICGSFVRYCFGLMTAIIILLHVCQNALTKKLIDISSAFCVFL